MLLPTATALWPLRGGRLGVVSSFSHFAFAEQGYSSTRSFQSVRKDLAVWFCRGGSCEISRNHSSAIGKLSKDLRLPAGRNVPEVTPAYVRIESSASSSKVNFHISLEHFFVRLSALLTNNFHRQCEKSRKPISLQKI